LHFTNVTVRVVVDLASDSSSRSPHPASRDPPADLARLLIGPYLDADANWERYGSNLLSTRPPALLAV
jgi:hypothetical protein